MKAPTTPPPAAGADVEPPKTTTPIAEYSVTEAAIANLKVRFAGVVYDLTKREDLQTAISARAELRTLRVSLEKKRVEIKAPALEQCRLIDSEAARISKEIEALEDPIDQQIKKDEQRRKDEQLAKEKAEAERIAGIQTRIANINALTTDAVGKDVAEIRQYLAEARSIEIDAEFGEFKATAAAAKARTVQAIEQLLAGAVAMEEKAERERLAKIEEEARLANERAEFERRKAEQDERDRREQERILAENKRLAEERAKGEADERARRAKIEADEKAAREKIEREQREAREKLEAEERQRKAARAEEDRKLAEQRAAEQAEREAEEQRQRTEREKIDAEKREVARRQAELMDGREMLTSFRARFGGVKEFTHVIASIDAYFEALKEAA
jgi:colicin import membrane protein